MAQALGQHYNLTANGVFQLRDSFAMLLYVTINKLGSAGARIVVYDNTVAAAPIVATIDATLSIGTLIYEVVLKQGLTVEIVGAATAPDITVVAD